MHATNLFYFTRASSIMYHQSHCWRMHSETTLAGTWTAAEIERYGLIYRQLPWNDVSRAAPVDGRDWWLTFAQRERRTCWALERGKCIFVWHVADKNGWSHFEHLRLLTFDIRNFLSLCGETYAGFLQRKQGPTLTFEVDSVETRQANVTTVKLHRAAKDGSGRR